MVNKNTIFFFFVVVICSFKIYSKKCQKYQYSSQYKEQRKKLQSYYNKKTILL